MCLAELWFSRSIVTLVFGAVRGGCVRYVLFPNVMVIVFAVGLVLASLDMSTFFDVPKLIDYVSVVLMVLPFVLYSVLVRHGSYLGLVRARRREVWIHQVCVAVVIFFFLECVYFGFPILGAGRDDFSGFPVFHVLFYSFMMYLNIASATLDRSRASVVVYVVSILVSVVILSRQSFVFCTVVFVVGLMNRRAIGWKSVVGVVFLFIFVFASLGDLRQEYHGDFVDNYIQEIGGANEVGKLLPSALYWVWLYIASPLYNLMYNLRLQEGLGGGFGMGVADIAGLFILPDSLVKAVGLETVDADLIVPYLNVGTGYVKMARHYGVLGCLIVSVYLLFVYTVLVRFLTGDRRRQVRLYFTVCSILMIFDNPYLRVEFAFILVFVVFAELRVVVSRILNRCIDRQDLSSSILT